MKLGKCVWALLVGAFLLSSFGTNDASAFARRRIAPAPIAVTPQPVYVAPAPTPTIDAAPAASVPLTGANLPQNVLPAIPYAMPYANNPYVAPFPYYSILPPALPYATPANARYGTGYDGRQKTAEDYGYGPQYFDQPPRKRVPLPVPEREREIDRTADLRKVRFEVSVPTDDAIVLIDGNKTKQVGRQRVFMTPPLDDDRIYSSTIEVFWTEGNQKRSDKQTFDFFPGDIVRYPAAKKVNP